MKFQIDSIDRTITVLDDCLLGELVTQLESILPEWKSYKLTKVEKNDYCNPIVIEKMVDRHPIYISTIVPYTYPSTISPYRYQITSGNLGTYNFDITTNRVFE